MIIIHLLSAPFMLRQAQHERVVLSVQVFSFTLSLSKGERLWIILNWKPYEN